MDLPRELVVALVEAGLLWGGQYRIAKDIMHFDLREGRFSTRSEDPGGDMQDFEEPLREAEEEIRASAQAEDESEGSLFASEETEQGSLEDGQEYGQEAVAYDGNESEGRESEEAEAIDVQAIKRLAVGELGDSEAAPWTHDGENEGPLPADPSTLPFLLAGPIVRRAEPGAVWFWFACSQEVTHCTPRLTVYQGSGKSTNAWPPTVASFRWRRPQRRWCVSASACGWSWWRRGHGPAPSPALTSTATTWTSRPGWTPASPSRSSPPPT